MSDTIERVGVAQVIYTVQPDPEDETRVTVTYWLENGQKIGSLNAKRG